MSGPSAWHIALVAAVYYAGAKLGMLTVMPEGMAIFWPPNAVVLAALIRFNGARLPLLGAAVVATEVAADVPTFSVAEALLFGLINFGEATAAFLVLRRLRFNPALTSLDDVWRFLVAGPLLAAGLASLLGAAVYSVFRGGGTTYLEFARVWWFGDALGLLILTPLFLGFAPFRTLTWRAAHSWSRVDALVALAGAVAAGLILARLASATLTLPFVLYVAARGTPRWGALAAAAATVLVVCLMTGTPRPFAEVPARQAVMYAQTFILMLGIAGLGFSTLLAQLRAQHALLERRVAERTRELEAANARLAALATVDALTGAANRRRFDEALALEAERSQRYARPFALILADIDRFKRINDEHGHAAGDEVLRRFAAILMANARASDVVARYGGEEFALLLPETSAAKAVEVAERVRWALERSPHDAPGWPVTASFGVAELMPGDSPRELVQAADRALYEAKGTGRDRVVLSGKSRHSAAV